MSGYVYALIRFFYLLSKPLPELNAKTPGVNDLDLKIKETRDSELVRFLNN